MARFQVLYKMNRQGLDPIIEADFYRTSGKFFEFLIDKEVVRTVQMDIILQIRRIDEDEGEGDESEEGDLADTVGAALEQLTRQEADQLAELLASMPQVNIEELLASTEVNVEELLASMPEVNVQELLASMPDLDPLLNNQDG